jgi:glucuronoarabinoxylan endo-1,4-beta-xylanase
MLGKFTLSFSAVLGFAVAGCGANSNADMQAGGGGNPGVGGATANGGANLGGSTTGTGSTAPDGGAAPNWGSSNTGGKGSQGGSSITASSVPAGGVSSVGGNSSAGGISSTGGSSSAGGSNSFGTSIAGSSPTGGTSAAAGTTASTGGLSATGGSYPMGGDSTTGGTQSAASETTATGGAITVSTGGTTSAPSDVAVDLSQPQQTIDGFGASDNFSVVPISTSMADLIFDPIKGMGFSLHRMGISPSGDNGGSWTTAILAVQRGAKLWAAPWSPPAADKTGGTIAGNTGGTLRTTRYDSWATTLANFAALTKSQTGADLYGVSAQNEPDFSAQVTYDGCVYSFSEMVDFIKVLGPKLHALTPPVKLLAPESATWNEFSRYRSVILADSTASSLVDVFATHDYGHLVRSYTDFATHPIWETETSDMDHLDDSMTDGMKVAGWIQDALTTGSASAWHYWWINQMYGTDNEGLFRNGTAARRFYVLGNYSKFIRPGYQRVITKGTPPTGVNLTAFKGPDGTVVIVAIASSAASLSIGISGAAPSSMTPWVTSSTDNMASKPAVSLSGSQLMISLAANSVTTFVGKP